MLTALRRPRASWQSLDPQQRRALTGIGSAVAALHVLGFVTLAAVVGDHAAAGAMTVGIGLTAYTLGMRHAFDADHIAAIDNTTRKLMAADERPLSVGFWFSLGHSTVVFALAIGISFGIRALNGPVRHRGSTLHEVTGTIGTLVSGSFLYLIAAINVVILVGVLRVFREMRRGTYDERALEEQLQSRGLINRLLGGLTRRIRRPSQMYAVGILFGLGFDTATEVALLAIAGTAGVAGLPWYGILCLPVLFAAGMSLFDTLDGVLMTLAYGWAFTTPVRRVFYNLTITGLSVAVAALIGTVELGGLLASHLNLSGGFWSWLENINLNLIGFAIFGLFIVTWAVAAGVWHFGRVEDRWTERAE